LTEKTPQSDVSSAMSSGKGLIQIFTGEGRGKTSAAIGSVIRALGNGLRIYIVVFMKAGYPSGEWDVLSRMQNVDIARFGAGPFVDPANIKPQDREEAVKALAAAHQAMLSGKYDLLVLDEVNVAVAWKLINLEDVISLIRAKPTDMELILTGRGADKEIVRMADLVTEMLNIKHPYDEGITARKGFEY
jgi:cob(I)alamin adenosyltransferase